MARYGNLRDGYRYVSGQILRNEFGHVLRREDGKTTRCEEDCCRLPCETCGPLAAFSYEVTGTDPCIVNLFDESVARTCGTIIAWEWSANGDVFSVEQNPEDINIQDLFGGDSGDITLRVMDEAGCTDSVEMLVLCCDCAGLGSPQAGFDVDYVDDSPCIYRFTSTAVPGICGEIVLHEWFRDAESTPFSTTSTTGTVTFVGAGVHTLRYRVTDANGCITESVRNLSCYANCSSCGPISLPPHVFVTVPTLIGNPGSPATNSCNCINMSGSTFTVPRGTSYPGTVCASITTTCTFCIGATCPGFPGVSSGWWIKATVSPTVLEVRLHPEGGGFSGELVYRKTGTNLCIPGSHSLSLVSATGAFQICGHYFPTPTTGPVTLVIPAPA